MKTTSLVILWISSIAIIALGASALISVALSDTSNFRTLANFDIRENSIRLLSSIFEPTLALTYSN